MKVMPSLFLAFAFWQGVVVQNSWANDGTDVFECSALADWAGLRKESKALAELAYKLSEKDAAQAIDLQTKALSEPTFLQQQSPDFWIGMWYGRSQAKIEELLQAQRPIATRPGAAAPERVKIALQKTEAWKPIAAHEYEERACSFRIAGTKP